MRFTILETPSFNIDKIEFELATNTMPLISQQTLGFTVYQNKTKALVIQQKPGTELHQLSIYNLNGKLIKSILKPKISEKISGDEFIPGLYIVRGISKRKQFSEKIIIQ
jgi:hypothetical protein